MCTLNCLTGHSQAGLEWLLVAGMWSCLFGRKQAILYILKILNCDSQEALKDVVIKGCKSFHEVRAQVERGMQSWSEVQLRGWLRIIKVGGYPLYFFVPFLSRAFSLLFGYIWVKSLHYKASIEQDGKDCDGRWAFFLKGFSCSGLILKLLRRFLSSETPVGSSGRVGRSTWERSSPEKREVESTSTLEESLPWLEVLAKHCCIYEVECLVLFYKTISINCDPVWFMRCVCCFLLLYGRLTRRWQLSN